MIEIVTDTGMFTPKFSTFNGGEEYVSIDGLEIKKTLEIRARITDSKWLMRLLLLEDALRQELSDIILNLTIPYLPYSRQDRVCRKGESFSLKVLLKLLSRFDMITTIDIHSDVYKNIETRIDCQLPFVINVPQIINLNRVQSRLKNEVDFIVSPDKGASEKTLEWVKVWNETSEKQATFIQAEKVRDLSPGSTGQIIATKLNVNFKLSGTALIVDDICDGGRTFLELAKVLREAGCEKVLLFVTHGILANGVDGTGCDHVYTTDSFPEKDDPRITIVRRWFY